MKLLVTSREVLNLGQEWLLSLTGLPFPSREDAIDQAVAMPLEAYGAVQLFVQQARRVRPGFDLSAEGYHVRRICRLVDGLPLGIELAAAWLKVLSCPKIAREIERNLDFLTTSHREVPARHHSLRAVFEHSWGLLAEGEQGVLRRLSVFRGGFRQAAAEAVAGASLPVLAALVEKSLVHPAPEDRYHLHELLRQFTAEKFGALPEAQAEAQERHSVYYLAFLHRREEVLKGEKQKRALAEIGQEIDNIRAAWNWAVEKDKMSQIDRSLASLCDFYSIRCRFQEGKAVFEKAVADLPNSTDTPSQGIRGKLLARLGVFYFGLGFLRSAKELLQESLAIARDLEDRSEMAFCLNVLGMIIPPRGQDYSEKKNLVQESLTLSREIGDQVGIAYALYNLGMMAEFQERYREAKEHYQESLAISREIGHADRMAYVLDRLGRITFAQGEYAESEVYYQESLALFKEVSDPFGTALALGGVAWNLAWGRGEARLAEAKSLFEESLIICREIGDPWVIGNRLARLGQICNELGEHRVAQQYALEGLKIAKEIRLSSSASIFRRFLRVLGDAAAGLGDFQIARQYLYQSLKLAIDGKLFSPALATLVSLAKLLTKEDILAKEGILAREEVLATDYGDIENAKNAQALELLTLVIHHPASWQMYKDQAVRLVAELATGLPPQVVAAAQERGVARDLWATAAELLAELAGETANKSDA